MQLPERGYSLTIVPWDGDGNVINQVNEKKRRCVLIFQKGEIETDMSLKKLELLSNKQGWLLIQNDSIINKKPTIKKDITETHINMLMYDQLKEYQDTRPKNSWRFFSKRSSDTLIENPKF